MDRTRRRATGRALVGLVVLAVALSAGLAAAGRLDAHSATGTQDTGSRTAALHEHAAVLRTPIAGLATDRLSKPRLRETFAITVGALAVALVLAARRRWVPGPPTLQPSFVRFGAPRAPPTVPLQP
jgi:hypothetical protein